MCSSVGPTWNIGNATYFHDYYGTRFTYPNVPWFPGNVCPYARFNSRPSFSYPPLVGTPLMAIPSNPTLGQYGTAEITLKGQLSENNCQFGYAPANVGGRAACCDAYGNCGINDTQIT